MNASAEPEVAALAATTLLRKTATIRERANALLVNGETKNVFADHPDIAARMAKALDEHLARIAK